MVNVWFAKVKPDAVIPTKREEDAGYDIFLCFEEDYIKLEPHETRMLPTGIASACDSGYYFQIQERGSTGSKGIAKRCGVIDSGYRGEGFLPIPLYFAKPKMKDYFDNLAETERFILYYTSKAASQAVLLPVPKTNINEVSYEELMSMASERMAGALGSSGK